MDVKVLEERDNPFLDRKELKIELVHPGEATPPKNKLIEEIASKYKVDKDHIVVDYVFTKKGMSSSIAKAKIYKKKPKIKKKIEKDKEVTKPEAKKEEKPKAEEKPKKQKVEEKKAEEKKEVKQRRGKE